MKWIVIAGVVAVAAVVAVLVASGGQNEGGGESRATPASGPDQVRERESEGKPVATKPGFRRFSGNRDSAGDSQSQHSTLASFQKEDTDRQWAPPQTEHIRDIANKLVGNAPVSITEVECRTERCRLVVTSKDAKEFMRVLEAMQSRQGYVGVAESLYLEGLVKTDDGTQEVDVFLTFAR